MTPRPSNPADRYQRRYGDPAPAARAMALDARKPLRGNGRPSARRTRPVRPNAALEDQYRQRLQTMIGEMNASVLYWMRAAYKQHEPIMAMDGDDAKSMDCDADFGHGVPVFAMDRRSPAEFLRDAFKRLSNRWNENFAKAAPRLADWFAVAAAKRSDAQLKNILRQGGFSVKFQMTPAAQDIIDATVQANVALIKSIPAQYLTQVEGYVMRSVQTGRDLGQLTKDLQAQFGVTKKRAAFIARDQNSKATASITKARQLELGLQEGIWMHSRAGKEPRPKHVAANGEKFDLRKGMKVGDKGGWVMPGEEINCRCTWRPVIPGFS